MDDVARCAGPCCSRPLPRAARLADARATASRLFRPLEEAGFHTVADLAALVFAAAADHARPRAELDQAAGDMLAAASELAILARRYRDASDLARQLDS